MCNFFNEPHYSFKEKIIRILKDYKPDIVGFNCLSMNRTSTFKTAELVKEINPNSIVLLGGVHPTTLYEQILTHKSAVDIIVLGEGEITIIELLKAIENRYPLETVAGIAFRKNSEIIRTEMRPFIKNLDTLPIPKHDAFSDYILSTKTAHMITSRGCPFGCTFCSVSYYWGRYNRACSPKRIVDEMEYLVKKYSVRHISFMDDVFTLNPKRTIKMCEEIINRGIKVSWDCATRVEVINEELVKWMAKANCVGVALGVESGSPKIISSIGKGISIEQIKKAFHLLREYGIDTGIFLMVGNPGENRYTIKETSNLVSELVKDYFRIRNGRQCGDNLLEGISLSDLRSVAALQLYPNTPVYELSKKQGFITDDYWLSEKPVPIYTYENPMEELEFFIFNIIFHAQKSRGFFKFIHFLFDFAKRDIKHLLKMVLVYFKVFRYIKKVKELIF